MSRSHGTDKPAVRARRRIARDADGVPALPRVVALRPRRGDAHPLDGPQVRRLLGRLPLEQLYGIERVELRARIGGVGRPFAEYRRDERAVVLFSLPVDEWWLPRDFDAGPLRLARYQARVHAERSGTLVQWRSPASLALWFWIEVLAHEIGHHVRNQYGRRYPRFARLRDEESVADLHSRRAWAALLRGARDDADDRG